MAWLFTSKPPGPEAGKSRFWSVLAAGFIAGLLVGGLSVGLFLARRADYDRDTLRQRAVAAYRDLDQARQAQRDAQERAGRIAEELDRIREYALRVEDRARQAQNRVGVLTEYLDRAGTECDAVTAGIGRAQNSLDESGNLLAELGAILYRVQDRGGTATIGP